MKKIKNRIVENINSMRRGLVLSSKLVLFFHRETNVEYLKISISIFFGKFINMLVMFMPLKLMFVLTGDKNIEAFATLEEYLGRDNYIALVLFVLTLFYFSNLMLNIFKAKLVKRQDDFLDRKLYHFFSRPIKGLNVQRTVVPFCQMLADALLLIIVTLILFVMNPLLSVYFFIILVAFYLFHEQWVFSNHETNLVRKLAIDKANLIQILSMLMFLVAFFALVLVVISSEINAIVAILMLLLIRLANGSFKSYMSAHMKLRRFYSL